MRYFIGVILVCFLVFPLSACSEQPPTGGDEEMQSAQESQTVSQEQMSQEEYEILQSKFTFEFQQYMTQLESALSAYNGSDDWWNSFQSLYDQAKSAWDQFQTNQGNIPEACQEEYQNLSAQAGRYFVALDTVVQARGLSGAEQQQKLAEASQLFIQANTQWQNNLSAAS